MFCLTQILLQVVIPYFFKDFGGPFVGILTLISALYCFASHFFSVCKKPSDAPEPIAASNPVQLGLKKKKKKKATII